MAQWARVHSVHDDPQALGSNLKLGVHFPSA